MVFFFKVISFFLFSHFEDLFSVFKFRESRGGFWFALLPLYSVHFPRQRILALSQLWRILSCNLQYIPFSHSLDSLLCTWLLNTMHLVSFYPPYHLTFLPSVLLFMCAYSWVIPLHAQFSSSPFSDFILFIFRNLTCF